MDQTIPIISVPSLEQERSSAPPIPVRPNKRPVILVVIVAIALILTAVSAVWFFFLSKSSENKVFSLDEPNANYQIATCATTKPESYWIVLSGRESENAPFTVENCPFRGKSAIRINSSKIELDSHTFHNVLIEGTLVEKWGKPMYDVSSVKPQPLAIPTPRPYTIEKLYLERSTDASKSSIFIGNKGDADRIVKWGDYLFFRSSDDQLPDKLTSYNIATGQTKVVYSDGKDELENDRTLNFIAVIDDTLYFSVSGYNTDAIFWLESPTAKPVQIEMPFEYRGSEVVNEAGRYWIQGGFGDSCGGIKDYSLFDLDAKRTIPFMQVHEGCLEGKRYLGFDGEKAMIIGQTKHASANDPYPLIFEQITRKSLESPHNTEALLDEVSIPKGVTAVQFNPETRQLALLGSELYLYELSDSSIRRVADTRTSWLATHLYRWENNSLCLRPDYPDESESAPIKVDLQDGTILNDDPSCQLKDIQSAEEIAKDLETKNTVDLLTKKLDLPAGYQIVERLFTM